MRITSPTGIGSLFDSGFHVNIFSNDRDIRKCLKFLHNEADADDDVDRAMTIPRRFLRK